jgi:type IV pilus biogenesis/stability protein PilW
LIKSTNHTNPPFFLISCISCISWFLVLAFGSPALRGQNAPPELPQLDLKEFDPAVREQVQEAYDAARANPHDAAASGKVGMLLDLYKRRELAAAWYERAHQSDPKAFRWLYYLGSLEIVQGKRAEATDALRAALRLDPGYLPARLKLADNLLAAGEWEEAGRIYEGIVKDYPETAEAYYGIGRIRAAQRDLTGAVESYRKACELFPPYGAAHYGLALAYRKLGDTAASEEHMKLRDASPNLVPPVPDPLRDEMRALDQGAWSHLRRGLALEEAGRIEDAIAEHEKALELDPDFSLAHANLIILYGRTNQPQKAEEHFRAAVRIDPKHADSYYNYGVLLIKEGKYVEAESMFRKAVEANPYHAQALHNLGFMLEKQGRLDEALQFYMKAVERQPSFPLAHFSIGRILANQRKYDEAISHFLLSLDPESESTPTYLYALAATYARAGNRQEALKYYGKAREQAVALGQAELLRSIDKDLRALGAEPPR